MDKVFTIIKIESGSNEFEYQFHGRALKNLKLGQIVYLSDNYTQPAQIARIVSYGRLLNKISGAMGCEIGLLMHEKYKEGIAKSDESFLWA